MKTGPVLSCLLLLASASSCADLTEPASSSAVTPLPERSAAAATATAAPAPTPTPTAAPAPAAPDETVAASHILVAYVGAMRANATIKRTKEEAKRRAESILVRARKGEDFAKLADENSDDPSAKLNHGSLGKFGRTQMVKPFADAAFALKPGGISTLVETPFGFHVIKRTE
jgi:NIMA-interacting peptidyl-prolyl cis-trans isomerase 1